MSNTIKRIDIALAIVVAIVFVAGAAITPPSSTTVVGPVTAGQPIPSSYQAAQAHP